MLRSSSTFRGSGKDSLSRARSVYGMRKKAPSGSGKSPAPFERADRILSRLWRPRRVVEGHFQFLGGRMDNARTFFWNATGNRAWVLVILKPEQEPGTTEEPGVRISWGVLSGDELARVSRSNEAQRRITSPGAAGTRLGEYAQPFPLLFGCPGAGSARADTGAQNARGRCAPGNGYEYCRSDR